MGQVTKIGKVTIRTINYTPTFRGKHNQVKCKCWLVLYNYYLNNEPGLRLIELVNQTGGNYKSISVLVGRWIHWGFIGYRSYPRGRVYHILKLGCEWLNRWWDLMPLARYIEEIEEVQRNLKIMPKIIQIIN